MSSQSHFLRHNYLLSMSFTAKFACSKDERQNQLEKLTVIFQVLKAAEEDLHFLQPLIIVSQSQ